MKTPKWATWRWRVLYRLFKAVPADEAGKYAQEASAWQRSVSDALDMTVEDHGTWYADVDHAVREITGLKVNRNLVREILEAMCRRNGLSLMSDVQPHLPARNYELALRLGIGEVFGLKDENDVPPQRSS